MRILLAVLTLTLASVISGAEPALRLAYVKNEANADNVYVANADGTGAKQITGYQNDGRQRCAISQLAWSPDGKRLAFLRKKDGAAYPELVVMDPDGKNPVTVAEGVKAFAWAPRP